MLEEPSNVRLALAGGGDRGASDRHVRCGSSGTRRRSARSRRAARSRASNPKSSRAPARVDATTRLSVRLGRVPDDLALVARHLGDELGELADGDLLGWRRGSPAPRRRSARRRGRSPRRSRRRRGTRGSESRRPRGRPRPPRRPSCGSARGSRARSPGRSCRVGRTGSWAAGRPRSARTARGRPAPPTRTAFFATPYGAFVSSGYPSHSAFLAKRDGRELRVRADRPRDDELRRLVQPCLLEDVHPHREVRVPVAAGVRPVGADPARPRQPGGRRAPGCASSNSCAASSLEVRSYSAWRATTTSWPSLSSRSTRCEPRKPPAAGDHDRSLSSSAASRWAASRRDRSSAADSRRTSESCAGPLLPRRPSAPSRSRA